MRTLMAVVMAALLPLLASGCDPTRQLQTRLGGPVTPAPNEISTASDPPVKGAPSAASAGASATAPKTSTTSLTPAVPLGLELTVLPVQGKRWALLHGRDGRDNYVKRLGSDGPLPGVRALGHRFPVMGLDGAHPWLISSDGERICVEALDRPDPPSCKRFRPDGAVLLDGRVVFVEQRPEPKPASTSQAAKGKAAKPKRRKGRRARRGKSKNLHRATDRKPVKMQVWLHRLDVEGRFVSASGRGAKPIDTALTFERPLPGMGLVDVVAAKNRLWLLFFEHQKAKKDKNKKGKWHPQARLRVAQLDRRGKLVRASKHTLYDGVRRYGYIEGHHRPQLFAHGSGVLMVGRSSGKDARTRAGFEAIGVKPRGVRPAANAMLGLDPWRRAGGPTMTRADFAALTQFAAEGPVRSFGQPDSDAGRVAWVGERAYYLCAAGLCDRTLADGATHQRARPFAASRSGLAWGAFSVGGEGLALSGDALIEVKVDGTLVRHPRTFSAAERAPGRPVRIGASWWRIQPDASSPSGQRVVRLLPDIGGAKALDRLALPGTSALVGGRAHGLFLSVAGGRLSSWRLLPDGRSEPLATVAAPLLLGLSAVARQGGGALLVGRSREGRPLSFAVHADGSRGSVFAVPAPLLPLSRPLLQPLPAGGALLYRVVAGGRAVHGREIAGLWLDNDGQPRASWQPTAPGAETGACAGWRLAGVLHGAKAGELQPLPSARGCALFPPQLTHAGYRWWGWRRSGLKRQAVLVMAPAGPAGPAGAVSGAGSAAAALSGVRVKKLTADRRLPAVAANTPAAAVCAPDMVSIAGLYCVDRFEAQLVHPKTALPLSPYYPSEAGVVSIVLRAWAGGRFYEGDLHAQALPLPPLLRARREVVKAPPARSRYGVVPTGFVSGYAAARVCEAAGKRLCSDDEWQQACRGEEDRKFPYGDKYRRGVCNVHSYHHPATTLHGNAAIGHLDPRLNLVTKDGQPMLRRTGATPACASRWGEDAIYDMVGNLDEWSADKKGSFRGGFYARSTKQGCSSKISGHPRRYLDYSLGVRCCSDALR